MNYSLSIIMTANYDTKEVESAFLAARAAIEKARVSEYEIIILNNTRPDGTEDGVSEMIEKLAARNQSIRFIRNKNWANLGSRFKQGVTRAKYDYIFWVPGDNENGSSLYSILKHIGEADIILPYVINTNVRPFIRRILSKTYTTICNILFGLNLRYYNAPAIHRREYLFPILPFISDNFAFNAEIVTLLIKQGKSYIEIPIEIQPSVKIFTSALKFRNVVGVIDSISKLFWRVRVLNLIKRK